MSSPKVVWTGLTERFSNFQSRDIGIIGPENHHKVWRERGRIKKIRQKIFHSIIYLWIPFHLHQPTLGRDEFYFSFSEIPYACFLNGLTPKKNCIKCAIATYKRTMQTKSTITNCANKIREILPKKFWLLSWTPLKISRNRRAWVRFKVRNCHSASNMGRWDEMHCTMYCLPLQATTVLAKIRLTLQKYNANYSCTRQVHM